MAKNLSVFFLTEGKTSPSTRFAVLSLLPYLTQQGIDYAVSHRRPEKYALIKLPYFNYRLLRLILYVMVSYPFSLICRFIDLWRIGKYDITFLQRDLDENHLRAWLEKCFKKYSNRLVFYFDDALWLGQNHFGQSLEPKIQKIIRLADLVIVSHQYLADYARQFNSLVFISPLSIDTRVYFPRLSKPPQPPHQYLTIGWSGGPWNYGELLTLAEVLKQIKQETGVRIIIHSGCVPPAPLQAIGVEYIPWQKENEVGILQRMDIAICPLSDTPWNRGKFSIKLLQYLAVGIPVVCSDVGVNREVITDRLVGFVVKDQEEWHARLLTLIHDQNKREEMSKAARQRAINCYSVERRAIGLAEILQSIPPSIS